MLPPNAADDRESQVPEPRIRWGHVINTARQIVESFDTPMTLRQLHYQLVARQVIPNVASAYKRLSSITAEGRRDETFPDLVDQTRAIHAYRTFRSSVDAMSYASRIYRRDRTEGQEYSIYLAVEKAGIVTQLQTWFGELGLPVLALRGYASQSYVKRTIRHVESQCRPAVLLYAGDHDPSGWDIPRDFTERTDCWSAVRRVALTPEQVDQYRLPESIGKETDSRKTGFVNRFGKLVQVEVDALPPDVLRGLFQDAISGYWDMSQYESVLAVEKTERESLRRIVAQMNSTDAGAGGE